jgi:hypothetical protein
LKGLLAPESITSVEGRSRLVDGLRLDLVGRQISFAIPTKINEGMVGAEATESGSIRSK